MADWYQTEHWVTREGKVLHVTEMSTDHLANTIAFLKARAGTIHNNWLMTHYVLIDGPHGDMAMDMFEDSMRPVLEAKPWQWLKRTPLVKTMRTELRRRREADDAELIYGSMADHASHP